MRCLKSGVETFRCPRLYVFCGDVYLAQIHQLYFETQSEEIGSTLGVICHQDNIGSARKQHPTQVHPLQYGVLSQKMSINYRLAAIADLQVLLDLVQKFHETEKLSFDRTIESDVLTHFLTDESLGQGWLIQHEHEVIGYILLTLGYSLEYRGRDAFIDELYLLPEYRRQGIGTQTLAFAEDTCRVLGVRALHLEVDFDNPNAQSLYDKVGYQLHNRFLMTKNLALHQ